MTGEPKLIIICGPTASGKSELAVRLAGIIDAEIINADSMQVYRGMNIGTAKPSPEQLEGIRHHLLDIVEPEDNFSAADFAEAADTAIHEISSRGRNIIVVGGTGLYIRALLYGLVDSPSGAGEIRSALHREAEQIGAEAILEQLRQVDPAAAAQMHPNNLVRIIRALEVYRLTGTPLSVYQQQHGFRKERYRSLRIGIDIERKLLYQRIEQRVDKMMSDGLLEEVQGLLERGCTAEMKSMRAIGYKESAACLQGRLTKAEAVELIKRDSRRYAKRQMTWFNADNEIIWLEYPKNFDTISALSLNFITV